MNFTLSSDLRYKLTLVKELGKCRWHWITVLWLKQYWLLPLPKSSLLWDTVLSGGWFQFVSWKYQPSSRLDCSSEYYRELQVSFAQKPQTCLHVPLWYNIWTEREREREYDITMFANVLVAGLCTIFYCTFEKHAYSEVQKPNYICVFWCCQSS